MAFISGFRPLIGLYYRRRNIVKNLTVLASAISVGALFRTHLYDMHYAAGASMYPTLPVQVSQEFVNLRYKNGRCIRVGDLISFQSPLFPGSLSGKRVIGMPGDFVVVDEPNAATVGGVVAPWEVDETLGLRAEDLEAGRPEPRMVQVPEGHVWVAGDNMAFSRDSRFHGPVAMGLIKGKIVASRTSLLSWSFFGKDSGLHRVAD